MSSSPPSFAAAECFFLAQTGVLPWEDPVRTGDERTNTLSIIVGTGPHLLVLFRWLLATEFAGFGNPTRVHLAELPVGLGALATERLLNKLRVDPPGTTGTRVERLWEASVVAISPIARAEQFSLDYLTGYRSTVVVAAAGAALQGLAHAMSRLRNGFDRHGLRELRDAQPGLSVIRALELETHAVLQAMGPPDALQQVESAIASAGARRLLEPNDVPAAIRGLHSRDFL
jgi:hypothetical protein